MYIFPPPKHTNTKIPDNDGKNCDTGDMELLVLLIKLPLADHSAKICGISDEGRCD